MSIFLLASTACANGSRGIKSSDKGELSDMKISIQLQATVAATRSPPHWPTILLPWRFTSCWKKALSQSK